ncbi:MAG: U32 family peptidase [Clostridia bacterium]|nr:U32 family peptidase [Clostridia bacterium]
MPEILAPAGGPEQLQAAVRSGADAVYLGTSTLNARRNAKNFNGEELFEAVRYCHAYGVKVYVTLNTLVADTELQEVHNGLQTIAQSGADAVIVQDLAVVDLVKKCCPTLALHASTQMSIHNVSGAKQLEEMGFKRIVTARELTLKEIEAIASSVTCEIEAFVHGAHCMSVSGMCYYSALLGSRSGNRGLCAQPCRLDFTNPHGRHFALSLKDMSLLAHLQDMEKAGVVSFKIEGRMKRPEYVAAAVSACKAAVNGESYDLETLKNVFSRSGFTDGYLTRKRDVTMFGYRTKEDVTAMPTVFGQLANLYRAERQAVPVTAVFTMQNGLPCSFTLSDGEHTVTATGEIPQTALNRPLDKENACRSLSKLGGTPFYMTAFDCTLNDGLMLPASALNAVRRDAAQQLYDKRAEITPHAFTPQLKEEKAILPKPAKARLRLHFTSEEQIFHIPDGAQIVLPMDVIDRNPGLIDRFGENLFVQIPALIWPEDEEKTLSILSRLAQNGIADAVCDNIGAVRMCAELGLTAHGGAGLNIFNSESLAQYAKIGLASACLSFECHDNQLYDMENEIPVGLLVYGRLPLMRLRACPMKGANGCGGCDGKQVLTDRKGIEFPVLCAQKKFSTLYNSVPLYLGDQMLPQTDFVSLVFTTETKEECRIATKSFMNEEYPPFKRTTGLYKRGVQ